MRIHRIRVDSFKGVRERTVEFPDTGITVLQGRNESGKSSMIEAFDLLLDAPDSSGSRAVKAANPVGDDLGIAVEAEFSLGGHRLLYRKHWIKAKKTTLRFLEGPRAGEALSGREAHDAVVALREQSDQTLWSVLRMLQGSSSGSMPLTDSSALRSALEQVSGGSAQSESGSSLLALAQAERDRYWTATGRESAPTKALRDRYAQAVAEHEKADAELAGLLEAEERLERDERALTAAQRSSAAADQEAEAARSAAESLQELKARREKADAEAEVAASRAQQKRLDADERTRRRGQADQAERTAAELEDRAQSLRTRADAAQEDVSARREALEGARARDEAARRRVRQIRTAQRLVEDRRRAAELAEAVTQLDQVAEQLTELGSPEDAPITQEAVDEIDAAERAAETARAQFEAGSAQLTVTALGEPRSVRLGHDVVELAAEASTTQAVTEPVDIELPGRLRVSVAPEQGRETRRRRLDEAQDALTQALRRWEVGSPQEARERLRMQTETQRQRRSLEDRRTLVLAGRDEAELRREHERLAAAPADEAHDADDALPRFVDAEEAAAALQDADETAEAARVELESARDAAAGADAALSARREELGAALASQQAQSDIAGAARAQLARDREGIGDEDLEAAAASAAAELARVQSAREQLEREWEEQDAEHVLQQQGAMARRAQSLRQQLDRARDQRSQSRGALTALDRDEKQSAFDTALTQRRAVSRELRSHLRRAAAAKLLAETMEQFQAEAHRRYTEPFRKRLEHLGSYVFGSSFQVELDEDLEVTRRFMHGSWIDEASLSTGAREQLAVLVRLAVATLVDPVDGVPVIFDDALGHTDPERLVSLAAALESAGRQAQVILLTATPERFAAVADTAVVRIGD
ncbi:hypothetical protein [Kocuria palustris]|uniref:hypothetical protein n=1 Tax=Kocuria palustris TaxID=71999 RepID=UPI00119FE395|nr:hypothetical protein [Kocuria palustris]